MTLMTVANVALLTFHLLRLIFIFYKVFFSPNAPILDIVALTNN